MKKFLLALVGFSLIFMLAACNESEPAASKDEDENNQEQTDEPEKENKEPELTAKDIFEKTMAASEDIESFVVKMDIEQEMGISPTDKIEFDTAMDMSMTMDPLALYQKMTMAINGEEMTTETYFTEEGMYIYDIDLETWVEYPAEFMEELMENPDENQNPMAELQQLEEFIDDISLKEEDDHYILTLSATSGEQFNNLIKETIDETLPEELRSDEEIYETIMNDFEINQIEYEYIIDKETYFPLALNMVMDMDIPADEDTVTMVQTMKADYTEYNSIGEIVIPQEAIDEGMSFEEYLEMQIQMEMDFAG